MSVAPMANLENCGPSVRGSRPRGNAGHKRNDDRAPVAMADRVDRLRLERRVLIAGPGCWARSDWHFRRRGRRSATTPSISRSMRKPFESCSGAARTLKECWSGSATSSDSLATGLTDHGL